MNLTDFRKKKSLTQANFGALLSPPASQALVSQWERGETRITLSYAVQIDRVTKHQVSCADCDGMFHSKELADKPSTVSLAD
jgi:DNA-binding transcriptional regulator YdaS (Cro superfamily)